MHQSMASSLGSMASAVLPLLLLSLCLCHVSGEEQHIGVVRVDTLLPGSVCSSSKVPAGGGSSLKVTHRRGPCSPFPRRKHSPFWLLRQDLLRVESLQRRISGGVPANGEQLQASQVTLPARRGTTIGTSEYVVTVGFGTPKKDQTVIFDTGSDVCWIQCQACAVTCHPQQEPVFDPFASSTYRNVSCNTPACRNLDVQGCSGGTCFYGVQYVDNSTTVGWLAQETLTLSPAYAFQSFLFGCGQDNEGLFGRTAGLVGLSRSTYSLVSQTSLALGDAFSYCLPATSSSTGHLTIGKSTYSASYTPMLTDSRAPSLYFVGLSGISVGGQRLPISSSEFQSEGTIIDSGTVITRLPTSAYSALRWAFRSAMSKYPMAQPVSLLDTCYDFSKTTTISYPMITLHFDGAVDLPLTAVGIFFVVSVSQVCLAFAAAGTPGGINTVGNVQQLTTEVIHDIGAQRIGFAAGACSS